jgi:hypothetical protein
VLRIATRGVTSYRRIKTLGGASSIAAGRIHYWHGTCFYADCSDGFAIRLDGAGVREEALRLGAGTKRHFSENRRKAARSQLLLESSGIVREARNREWHGDRGQRVSQRGRRVEVGSVGFNSPAVFVCIKMKHVFHFNTNLRVPAAWNNRRSQASRLVSGFKN